MHEVSVSFESGATVHCYFHVKFVPQIKVHVSNKFSEQICCWDDGWQTSLMN